MKNRADVLVYNQGLTDSREKAKRLIMAGVIYVDQVKVLKPGEMFSQDTFFTLKGSPMKYVSRGGYKLEKAISSFDLSLKDKICGDFGASTGGFTDCMLQYDAKKVYAIDVGYGQLDWSIRTNNKVVSIERTNLRYLDNDLIEEKLDFISIDVSFISLTLILPKAFELLSSNGMIVVLIKPQFEASKEEVGKKGVVKSLETRTKTIEKIYDFVIKNDYKVNGLTYSPIKGAEGNQEFLMLIGKKDTIIEKDMIKQIVEEGNNLAR